MNKKINPLVHFTPRVLAIIFILFLAMFSLDVFDMNLGVGGIIVGLLMHNIPVFILIALLVVAWKYEIVGGIAFIAGGLFYIGLLIFGGNFEWYMLAWSVPISGPAFLVGILFLIEWFQKKKIKSSKIS